MNLTAGVRLGPYEILSAIGAGGMGEVYRARDTKLNRDVAIKVLPALFASDPDRLARFTREAQVLASLNHPNIAAVYGIEGDALVMELVDGDDLSDQIAGGALPYADALKIARQIADALEAAHEQGVVHRDLKPANVKVRPNGAVKVLDFGLALSRGRPAEIANSPTFTSPLPMTARGVILGTAAYMAPEQARGKAVDRRADIWAFGCVLYEMLTGVKAFDGESVADVMGAIIGRDPDWTRLPPSLPSRVGDVLRWCLRRDPAERLKDFGDVRILLADVDAPPVARPSAWAAAPSGRRRALTAAGWTLAAGLAAALLWKTLHGQDVIPPRSMRFELPLAPAIEAQQPLSSSLALSPDGGRLVYVARQGNTTALYLRDLATGEARLLPDTADAYAPFFSPDGASVGFIAADRLRTLQLSAPLARDLTTTARGSARVTADWTPSGDVIFAEPRGLARVRGDGGAAGLAVALLPSESGLMTPRALPDRRYLLAAVRAKTSTKTDDASQITIVDTVTNTHRVLIDQGGSPALLRRGTDPRAPAFLIYARGGRLWAATFDLPRLAIAGAPQPVVDNVEMRPNGDAAQFAVSNDGTLAYLEASPMELAWVDRRGAATPVSAVMRRFALPRLAPDERRIAVEVQDVPHQVWLLDTEHDLLTPLTEGPGGSHNFAWSPDGRALAFTASTGARTSVMWMALDGSHAPQMILPAGDRGAPWIESWSRDGRWMAIVWRGKGDAELQLVPLEPGNPPRIAGAPQTIAKLGDGGLSPDFSPDSQWVAWCQCSANLTQPTIYVSRISDGRPYQVGEGFEPRWSASGRELFFREGKSMMAVDVTLGTEVTSGRPHKLFDGDYLSWGGADYDVGRDGRFVMIRPAAASATGRKLNVRLNWIEELRKLQF